MNNPNIKHLDFEGFRKESGRNAFTLSPKKWIESTNAIGMWSKSSKYGGTFAHVDIAMEFKLYIIKDYQRLKTDENHRLKLEWE